MNFDLLLKIFSLSSWNIFLKIFLLVFFLGYVIFMVVVRRQIVLMSRLFKTGSKFLLLFFSFIFIILGLLGFLLSLISFY